MAENAYPSDDVVIDRSKTGKRILFTIVFAFIARLLEVLLAFVVLFELLYAFITRRPPHPRVTRFAHRLLRYGFVVGQYTTYNTDDLPFPFDELPSGTEHVDINSAVTP